MRLKRSLGFWAVLFISINAIIGTGIFFTPSIAAEIAGPASLLSWIIAAIISVIIAFCFAELVALFPKSGGIYEYSKKVFGDFVGFLIGWTGWVVSNVAIAMLIVGGLNYLTSIYPMGYLVQMLLAFAFLIFVNYVSFRGIDLSAKLLLIFATITLFVVITYLIVGLPSANPSNLYPFFTKPKYTIFIAVFLILETFFGWENATYLAEETKRPREIIPKALILSTIIISILAIGVVFVSLTTVPLNEFTQTSAPVAFVLQRLLGEKYASIILGFIFLNIMGTAASWIITTPRLIYAMARDKMLPESLSEVHPKFKTPYKAIIFQTLVTGLLLLSGSFRLLLGVVVPLAILMYSVVILAVPKLRFTKPHLKRKFKMPFGEILPILVVLALFASMFLGTSIEEILLGLVLILLGIPLYLIAVLGYHKKIIKWFSDRIAWISYVTYNYFTLKYVEPHIVNFLSDPSVFTVADIGCGVGVLTRRLAEKAIPLEGKVYGIDFSEKEIAIAKKRKEEEDVRNLEYFCADLYNLKENKEANRRLKKLDAVIGIGILQYLPDVIKALKIIHRRVRKGGKIYFVDYDYIGKLFEKPWIEHDDEIIKMFEKAGFKVRIWRQKRLLWQYVHIYGYKK